MEMTISSARKSRGRPPIGATPVNVRFPPAELAALDAWIKRSVDGPSRPLAIRRLVEQALGAQVKLGKIAKAKGGHTTSNPQPGKIAKAKPRK